MKRYIKIFLTAFTQILLVALNTFQIAKYTEIKDLIGIFIVGFLISLLWCFNVKTVSICSLKDKLIYCTGAALGCIIGVLIGTVLYK